MSMKLLISLYTIFVFVGVLKGEVIDFAECEGADEAICKVKEVRVLPCQEAKSNKPCKFKKGTNVTIEFDYEPGFDSERMLSQAYSVLGFVELPLPGMDRDGCKRTDCPVKNSVNASYKNTIFMSSLFPSSNYRVKWRLWDAKESNKECCFIFRIKLGN